MLSKCMKLKPGFTLIANTKDERKNAEHTSLMQYTYIARNNIKNLNTIYTWKQENGKTSKKPRPRNKEMIS